MAEALQNAFKDGGDGVHIRLVLDGDESELRFSVCDDGPGFDPMESSLGTGLDNMAERLGAVGGELSVSASIEGGTTISGAVPTCQVPPARHIPELLPALPRDTRWPSSTSPSARAVWT